MAAYKEEGKREVSQYSGKFLYATPLTAVQAAHPGNHVAQFVPPRSESHSSLFKVSRENDSTLMVFVDPYTAEVLGSFDNADRLYTISDDIHGTLLLGKTGDALIELAAGLGFLLLMTGLYLHWPRTKPLTSILIPSFLKPSTWKEKKRTAWKAIHASAGFYLSFFLLFFLLTGMAWTGIWGAKIIQPWNSFPAEESASFWQSSAGVTGAHNHAEMNTDNLQEVPWGLEMTPMPASHQPEESQSRLTLDQVFAQASQFGFKLEDQGAFSNSFRIGLPADETSVYSIMAVTMSRDITNPFGDRTVHLDQYSGELLADIGFDDYNAVAKAMAAGIAWHMGADGWWNVILAAAICIGLILLSITGLVLWWKRRNPAVGFALNAPPRAFLESLSKGSKALIALALLTGVLFPVTGAAMLVFIGFEWLQSFTASGQERTT